MIINKNFKYAIIGASNDKTKFGYKVLVDLSSSGYNAIPINPKANEINGLKSYASLTQLHDANIQIDVVVFVVPPNITRYILNEVKDLGINKVWMQPGSESIDAINFCENNNIECVHDMCIMIEKN